MGELIRATRIVLAVLMTMIVIASVPPAEAAQSVGNISRIKGAVIVKREGHAKLIRAKQGMALFQKDTIMTRAKAYVRFKMIDGSIMTLGEKGELSLDEFSFQPKEKKRSALFSVALGKLRVFANKMLSYRDNRFNVKTPTAVAGVRGTVFMVWVESPAVTRVACFDSAVEVASVFKPDEYVVLTKNIVTSVGQGALPTQPVLMTEEQFKQFQSGFAGDIKPTDQETGYEDDGDKGKQPEEGPGPEPGDQGPDDAVSGDEVRPDQAPEDAELGGDDPMALDVAEKQAVETTTTTTTTTSTTTTTTSTTTTTTEEPTTTTTTTTTTTLPPLPTPPGFPQ